MGVSGLIYTCIVNQMSDNFVRKTQSTSINQEGTTLSDHSYNVNEELTCTDFEPEKLLSFIRKFQ